LITWSPSTTCRPLGVS